MRARGSASELRQNPEVPFPERTDVGEVVLQLRDALDPAAEGEARPLLGIDADVLEHTRVDHPGTAHLEPARVAAGGGSPPPPGPPPDGGAPRGVPGTGVMRAGAGGAGRGPER